MKSTFIIIGILMFGIVNVFGQTATDFEVDDCDGVSHHLFSELDAGKVVIIAWVMPCASCIVDPLEAYIIAQEYEITHPGQVLFYLVDDYANTSCGSLETWAANYEITNCPLFSNNAIDMSDYGTPGMPKIVILGGTNHQIYFNENSVSQGIGLSIENALSDINTSIEEEDESIELTFYPNPVSDILNVSYQLNKSSEVNIEVLNTQGTCVVKQSYSTKEAGEMQLQINVDGLSNGVYLLKLDSDEVSEVIRFVVSN